MAINTVLANNQAAEVSVGADRLRTAESGLHAYGDALQANWDLSSDMRLAVDVIQCE